jgi:hypothetical protein
MNPNEWMDSMADHTNRCCNGNCDQGRTCPRRTRSQSLGMRLLGWYDVVAWIVAALMLVGALHV